MLLLKEVFLFIGTLSGQYYSGFYTSLFITLSWEAVKSTNSLSQICLGAQQQKQTGRQSSECLRPDWSIKKVPGSPAVGSQWDPISKQNQKQSAKQTENTKPNLISRFGRWLSG